MFKRKTRAPIQICNENMCYRPAAYINGQRILCEPHAREIFPQIFQAVK